MPDLNTHSQSLCKPEPTLFTRRHTRRGRPSLRTHVSARRPTPRKAAPSTHLPVVGHVARTVDPRLALHVDAHAEHLLRGPVHRAETVRHQLPCRPVQRNGRAAAPATR
ncbi:hypothetical protein PHLGIDRAFT_236639 [Phlebiopsis gigantea 11061_1 CR5-6]|uniref:Uncharacterized protein n=1 Tax=Phlebiopsis gigantea (strain 11061_1 CR5-6) TaxID=745531 RepID=A0A0C3PDT6_PHLG1|nr:hypothetical protein PHLGIDRAFT_236639 [Phlebiopsis gigantea 11061_1 CR5-6]